MTDPQPARRYRFGVFEADATTGELRKHGVRLKVHAQPFQVLLMLLERPGELLTREELARGLWPDGTFVDYEHGVNSAVNRLREALGDRAGNPRFIETLARRGYRFLAPVERIVLDGSAAVSPGAKAPIEVRAEAEIETPTRILASEEELPKTPYRTVRTLFILLQLMYLGFYIGALANLPEIEELLAALPKPAEASTVLIVTAGVMIPVRVFLLCLVLFRAPGMRGKFLRMWPFLLLLDVLWALSPFLLLHHINFGLALSCTAILVYSPFAQRALMLMGPGRTDEQPNASANG